MSDTAARHLGTGAVAWRNVQGALLEFQGALQRRDFAAAEAAQLTVSASMDSYLDALLGAYREIDREERAHR